MCGHRIWFALVGLEAFDEIACETRLVGIILVFVIGQVPGKVDTKEPLDTANELNRVEISKKAVKLVLLYLVG